MAWSVWWLIMAFFHDSKARVTWACSLVCPNRLQDDVPNHGKDARDETPEQPSMSMKTSHKDETLTMETDAPQSPRRRPKTWCGERKSGPPDKRGDRRRGSGPP